MCDVYSTNFVHNCIIKKELGLNDLKMLKINCKMLWVCIWCHVNVLFILSLELLTLVSIVVVVVFQHISELSFGINLVFQLNQQNTMFFSTGDQGFGINKYFEYFSWIQSGYVLSGIFVYKFVYFVYFLLIKNAVLTFFFLNIHKYLFMLMSYCMH